MPQDLGLGFLFLRGSYHSEAPGDDFADDRRFLRLSAEDLNRLQIESELLLESRELFLLLPNVLLDLSLLSLVIVGQLLAEGKGGRHTGLLLRCVFGLIL